MYKSFAEIHSRLFFLHTPTLLLCCPSLCLRLARTVIVIASIPWSAGPEGGIELCKLGAKSSLLVIKCERRRTSELNSDSWWMRLDTYWQTKFEASLVRCDTFGPVAATLRNRLEGEEERWGVWAVCKMTQKYNNLSWLNLEFVRLLILNYISAEDDYLPLSH